VKICRKRFLLVLLTAVALAAVLYLQPYRLLIVSGDSMEPNVHNGDWMLVDRLYYRTHPVRVDDIIWLKNNREYYIKRVTAVSGDELLFIRIPGASAIEVPLWKVISALDAVYKVKDARLERIIIGDNRYFVMGDNRPVSEDSRDFDAIAPEQILGKVVKKLF